MRQGTYRYCSALEKEQAELYMSFVERTRQKETKKNLSQKSLGTYKGAVTAQGGLTKAVREAAKKGELELPPDSVESLLTMTDPKHVRAVKEWWLQRGQFSYTEPKVHMKYWLAFRRDPLEDDGPEPEHGRSRRLQVPPHGVRLRVLLAPNAKSLEGAMDLYELLQVITGYKYNENCLREHTAPFRQLWWDLLRQIEEHPEETAMAVAQKFPRRLKNTCQDIVPQVMKQHGIQILKDLERRRVAYDDSLLPCLEGLRTACLCTTGGDEACARALLPLIRTVLLDCDPIRQFGDAALEPGAALRDSRLWDSGLLWAWMDQQALSAGAVEVLLRLPWPEKKDQRSHLAVVLLHSMLALVGDPDGRSSADAWKAANRWLEEAIVFCGKHWDDLYPALANPAAGWCEALFEPQLLGDVNDSVFHAGLLLRKSELLLKMPVEDLSKARQNVLLVRAQSAAKEGTAIVKTRLADYRKTLEHLTGQGDSRQMLARLRLCDAKAYRRFAELEVEENCLTDVLGMYICPCRAALADKEAFPDLSDGTPAKLKKQRTQVCQECFDTFFGEDSPFVRRLRLLPGTDDQGYQAEYAAWRDSFGPLLAAPQAPAVSAPHVILPLDPETLRDPERFKPVYSGVFDSVLGKDPAQQKPAELAAFQLLGGCQTSLLQMNQLVDNLSVLRLLHEPGFRTACREGIITLSCFGELHRPWLYLKQKLEDPGFRFSCTQAFSLQEEVKNMTKEEQRQVIRRSARGAMLCYLQGKATLKDFPAECDREEMAFLAESWKIAFDCFQLSDLRRYHQNSKYRYPPQKVAQKKAFPSSLSEVLQKRFELLIQEAQRPDSAKDLHRLLKAQAWCERFGDLPNRSAYDDAIDALKSDDPTLEDFRSVVHQSYFLSNGSLCCDHVLLTERDPNFILLLPDKGLQVTYQTDDVSPTTEYFYRQAWKPGTDENIGWPDLCEIALINREMTLKDKGLSLEKQIAGREKNTGLKYCAQGGDIIPCDYTAKLSTGERTHVCPAEKDSSDTRLLAMCKTPEKGD